MKKDKEKRIMSARESLEEILKRIGPYIPKTPKIKEEPPSEWKLVGNGKLPPLNSVGQAKS